MTYIVLIASVVVGVLLVQFIKDLKPSAIKLLLAFSGAYLFAISVFHLLPEIYLDGDKQIGLFFRVFFSRYRAWTWTFKK